MLEYLRSLPKTRFLEPMLLSVYQRLEQPGISNAVYLSNPRRFRQIPKQLCTRAAEFREHPLNKNRHSGGRFARIVNQEITKQVRHDSDTVRTWSNKLCPLKVLEQRFDFVGRY